MNRKGFILALVLILAMTMSTVFAQGDITIRIDSTEVEFNEDLGRPFINENHRTLVPFRAVLESYGAEVDWDGATRTARAVKDDITIEIPLGENYIVKNGEKIQSDTAAIIKNNRTYLPIRKVMESLGAEVQWDQSLQTVVVTTESFDAKSKIMDAYDKSMAWDNYDMLMKINMLMTGPNEEGNLETIDMKMDMKATAFMDPIKMMMGGNMIMDLGASEISQPIQDTYMVAEGDKFITYTSAQHPLTQEVIWIKDVTEDAGLVELMNIGNGKSRELNEQSIKEVVYLGTYKVEDRELGRYEVTISFEGLDEIMEQIMPLMSGLVSAEELEMSLEILENLEDMKYIYYMDEATGEFVKMEMDMTSMMNSMFKVIPEMDKVRVEMDMVGEYQNINNAEDFKIPEEALSGISMEEYMEILEEFIGNLDLEALEGTGE